VVRERGEQLGRDRVELLLHVQHRQQVPDLDLRTRLASWAPDFHHPLSLPVTFLQTPLTGSIAAMKCHDFTNVVPTLLSEPAVAMRVPCGWMSTEKMGVLDPAYDKGMLSGAQWIHTVYIHRHCFWKPILVSGWPVPIRTLHSCRHTTSMHSMLPFTREIEDCKRLNEACMPTREANSGPKLLCALHKASCLFDLSQHLSPPWLIHAGLSTIMLCVVTASPGGIARSGNRPPWW
jgi:hypothetical protein